MALTANDPCVGFSSSICCIFGTVTSFVSAKVIKLSVAVTSFFLPAAVTQLNSISVSEMALVI